MERAADALWHDALVDLLQRSRLSQGDDLGEKVNAAVRRMDIEVTIYLVDHEQVLLRAIPEKGKPTPPPLAVDGTPAGEAFTEVKIVAAGGTGQPQRLWIPMVDGSERLGVADVVLGPDAEDTPGLARRCAILIGLVGHLIATKMPYGDSLHLVRRTRPMSPATELLLHLMPPLTFSCKRMVVSAILEPAYDVGGDGFDYAVDDALARLVVVDAMGHGLRAGLTTATVLSAIRAARRDGRDLPDTARAVDAALAEQFDDGRFATAVLAELNLDTGALRYINAGHPQPVVMRNGKAVLTLSGGRRLPLGLAGPTDEVGEETLRPEDRLLLYTDGVTEARALDGTPFGLDRLIDLAEQTAFAGLPAPETLRRLGHSILRHQNELTDDATLMLVEWSTAAAERTQP
jgi:hypothetical protein